MLNYLIKALAIVLLSVAKFTFVPIMAVGFGFGWLEMFLYMLCGGVLGLIVFLNFSEMLLQQWFKYFPKKKSFSTTKARKYLTFWKKYGLYGVSILSPIILTIPIGTFLAIRFGTPKSKLIPLMLGSIIIWSGVMSTLGYLGLNLVLR